MNGRNKYHNNIVNRHGVKVEIIYNSLTESQALISEVNLIKLYKSFGHCEANLTLGGEGITGYKHTTKSKALMSKSKKGTLIGADNPNFGKTHSKEIKQIVGDASKRRFNDLEWKSLWLTSLKSKDSDTIIENMLVKMKIKRFNVYTSTRLYPKKCWIRS